LRVPHGRLGQIGELPGDPLHTVFDLVATQLAAASRRSRVPVSPRRGSGPAAWYAPHRQRAGSVDRLCRFGGSPWPAAQNRSDSTRSPGPRWCPREPGWCATPSPRRPWSTTPRHRRAPAPSAQFYQSRGCGTDPSSGIRQYRGVICLTRDYSKSDDVRSRR
jgi:hypothetical protein